MKQKSVICAIVKNEQRFIREWVEYYMKIGFERLYIYEDFGSDSHKEQLRDYIEKGQVILSSLEETRFIPLYKKGTMVQNRLYKKFFEMCKNEEIDANWVGFFDVDEFIMFEDEWNLERLEEEFSDCGGVLLSWRCFGANGHLKRPKGKVVDNYTTHMPDGIMCTGTVRTNSSGIATGRTAARIVPGNASDNIGIAYHDTGDAGVTGPIYYSKGSGANLISSITDSVIPVF